MNYEQAKSRALYFQLIGYVVFIVCVLAVTVSMLKGLYFHFDSEPIFRGVSILIKNSVDYIYQNTQFLNVLWKHSPVPNMMSLFDTANLLFAFIYFPMFIGASLIRYGKKLSNIIRKIDAQIFEEQLRGKVRNKIGQKEINIPVNSFSSTQFHTLYIAPFIVALLILLIQKVLGS